MTDETVVPLGVRADDVDSNGHVRGASYVAYADHARWELVQRAGVNLAALADAGIGPVNLETTVRFLQELRLGDEVLVASGMTYGPGRTGQVRQQLTRVDDGVLVAEVSSVCGLLDLGTRRLLPDPASRWRSVAARPSVLGL